MTPRACFRASLILAVLALASACGGPSRQEPGTGDEPEAATRKVQPGTAYDFKLDPLVNPPAMFEPAPADSSQIATDETLYRNLEGNPASLNTLFASSAVEQYVGEVLWSGLFSFDTQMKWKLNDEVVEHYEESEDHLKFTAKMKAGMTWQDGAPFDAEDVCYSWRTLLDEKVPVAAQRSGPDELEDCKVLDPLTVQFVAKKPSPNNIWNINFGILPKHLYEKDQAAHPDINTGEYYDNLNRHPITNGPYKFVEWLENDKIVLERWDGYWGKKPNFKRMVFRIIPDPNILLLTFNKGDIDECRLTAQQFANETLPGSDFAKAGGAKCLAMQWDLTYLGWNMDGSNPFFGDVRVRRAMTLSTDIKRMQRDLTYNLYAQCQGIFHPDSWEFPKEGVQLLPYDLDAAAKLLDEAGWIADAKQEGWRYKAVDGKPVRFEFTMLIPQGSALGAKISAILQEDLRSIGVKMEMQTFEWATWNERARKHEFEAITAAWGTGVDPDTDYNLWHSSQYDKDGQFGRNYGGYKNPRVDELFDQGRVEFDREKRAAMYGEIHRLIYDDQPYTFLFNRPVLWALHGRIQGVTSGPRGVFGSDPSILGWWVKPGATKYVTASAP